MKSHGNQPTEGRKRRHQELSDQQVQDKSSTSYVLLSMFAGGIAGCAAKTTVAPLDRVKILFQTDNPSYAKFSGTHFGVFRAMEDIRREFGVRGLYQGNLVTLLRIFPYAAIKFMAYEQIKSRIMPTAADESSAKKFFAGSLAGRRCTSVMFSYPLDLIRVRLAYETRERKGIIQMIRTIYDEPVPYFIPSQSSRSSPLLRLCNFYRGLFPTIYGMIPYAGVSFSTYEHTKMWMSQYPIFTIATDSSFSSNPSSTPISGGKLNSYAYLLCGAISGISAQTASYPFEVIRRHMQVSTVHLIPSADSRNPSTPSSLLPSTLATIKEIWRARGFRGFWVGLSIGYMKVVPMFAVSFWTYEWMKEYLEISD